MEALIICFVLGSLFAVVGAAGAFLLTFRD